MTLCFIFRSLSQSWPDSPLYVDSRDIHFHISRDIFMTIYARKNRTMHFAQLRAGDSFLRLHDINRVNPQSMSRLSSDLQPRGARFACGQTRRRDRQRMDVHTRFRSRKMRHHAPRAFPRNNLRREIHDNRDYPCEFRMQVSLRSSGVCFPATFPSSVFIPFRAIRSISPSTFLYTFRFLLMSS